MRALGASLLLAAILGGASTGMAQDATSPRYLAEIELHNEAELRQLLERAQLLAQEGRLLEQSPYPVRFVLHGPEVRILLRENYSRHMQTVDLARELSEQGLVDVKVCETWMGSNRVAPEQLPNFVGTVPYAPVEKQRLISNEQYIYF